MPALRATTTKEPTPFGLSLGSLEQVRHGILLQTESGQVVFANAAAERILGQTLGEMNDPAGGLSRRLRLADGSPCPAEALPCHQALATGQPLDDVVMGVAEPDSAEVRWLQISAVPLARARDPRLAMVSLADVTRSRKRLVESESRYEYLLENLNEIVMMVDNDDRVQFVNRRFTELLGYQPEEILGRIGNQVLLAEGDRDLIQRANLQRRKSIYSQYEVEMIGKDGTRIPFLINGSPRFDEQGRVIGSIGAFTDIRDRKETERLLQAAQQVAHMGLFIVDLGRGRWESSPIVDAILGIDPAYPRDLAQVPELVVPAQRSMVRDRFRDALRHRTRMEFDCQITRPRDQDPRWVSLIGEFEGGPRPGPGRMIGTLQDITDRKRLEQQLAQAQKLEGVGTLAGGIAHDFNNVLAMILGAADLLASQLEPQPNLRRQVARIKDAAERGAAIAQQLLLFARPDQGEVLPLSLVDTVTELAQMLAHFLPKRIRIETVCLASQARILGNPGQIYQALMNLALNAADAMASAGRLTLTVFEAGPVAPGVGLDAPVGPSYVGVEVADTGAGMEDGLVQKIFEPFFSTKEKGKGTGLGLAIVHGIVKSHSGFIEVQSSPGQGTRFRLYFPAAAESHPEPAPATVSAAPRTGCILLVEDEIMLREVLEESLAGAGHRVLVAANGAEALSRFQEHGGAIDLVITDLGMPEMGGEELIERLREIDQKVRIIVSSGHMEGLNRERLTELGIARVLQKPYRLKAIHLEIQKLL
jgi:PAS domain S-box-containing protein